MSVQAVSLLLILSSKAPFYLLAAICLSKTRGHASRSDPAYGCSVCPQRSGRLRPARGSGHRDGDLPGRAAEGEPPYA